MGRSIRILAPVVVCLVLAAACSGSGNKGPSDAGGGSGGGAAGGAGGGSGGGSGGGTAGGAGGGTAGGAGGGAGGSDGGTDGGSSSTAVLDTATAHIVGRRGYDVKLTITAHDPNKRIAGLMVRLIDGSGQPVLGFDSHQSGTLDSALGPAAFDTNVENTAAVSTTATMSGLAAEWDVTPARISAVASLGISLRDTEGNSSNEIVTPVVGQDTEAFGAACDTTYVSNRCADTLYCAPGSSPTCQTAPAPQITKLAYLTSDAGPSILITGTEPSDDLSNIHVDFEDGGGQPLSIPLDGDNEPPVSSFDSDATGDANNGTFFVRILPAVGFDQLCPQIAVTPSDTTGAAGTAVSARPVPTPMLGSGAACDNTGFSVCGPTLVCAPSGSAAACTSLASAQTGACHAATVLAPVVGTSATTYGHTSITALWNPPDGCSSNNPTGKPVALATLHLATTANTLTLSTDNPGTDFDTVLYLLQGCPATSAAALGCNDDDANGADSTLTLQNVAAGDYNVVVGAFDIAGGSYQLTATVQ